HSLAPVQLSFRAYYKVEVPVDHAPVGVPAPSEPVLEAMPMAAELPVAEPVMAEPAMAEATAAAEQPSNGKRSLGFFAH
ncbi:MAG TPA: hypothetical protein VKJ07_01965, partial [Mycobacteriales bacterium]|nr:hypothetical protein [Mycobacteriales bacterium]